MRKRWLLIPVIVLAATQGSVASADPVHTLDRVRYRDFVFDLRTVPDTAWLHTARPTRSIGTDYPTPDVQSYDVVIHLHEVHRARPF